MTSSVVLIIDAGTSSIRLSVLDITGNLCFSVKNEYELLVKDKDAVEMSLADFNNSLCDVLNKGAAFLLAQNKEIICISVTAQRSSVIPINDKGEALSHALMWQDRRSFTICESFSADFETIRNICGMNLSPVMSAPKILYLKKYKQNIYDKAYKFIGFQEYILFVLTGHFVTDTSIASRTGLFDVTHLCWSKYLLEKFDIDKSKLCSLIEVGSIVGEYSPQLLPLPVFSYGTPIKVVSAGGDQQCAALGAGCYKENVIVANSGTGSYAVTLIDSPIIPDVPWITCNVSAISGKWILENAVLSSGKSLNWINRMIFETESEAKSYERFNDFALKGIPGSNGLIFDPSFVDSGKKRGGLFNITLNTSKYDIARAVLEGIVASLAIKIEELCPYVNKIPDKICISGGLCHCDIYNIIQAEIYETVCEFVSNIETTTVGAWMSACVRLSLFNSYEEAYRCIQKKMKVHTYVPKKQNKTLYTMLKNTLKNKNYL